MDSKEAALSAVLFCCRVLTFFYIDDALVIVGSLLFCCKSAASTLSPSALYFSEEPPLTVWDRQDLSASIGSVLWAGVGSLNSTNYAV